MKSVPEELPARGAVALVVAAEASDSSKKVGDGWVSREGLGLAYLAKLQRERLED